MLLLMMGSAVLIPFLRDGELGRPLYLILTVTLALGAVVYALVFEKKVTEGFLFWLTPLVYCISVALLLLFDNPFQFPFWTFGGLLLLCGFKLRYGMVVNIFLVYIIGCLQETFVSEILLIHILGILILGFTMPHARAWKDGVNLIISVAAIVITVRLVCFFAVGAKVLTGDIVYVTVVYAIVICAVMILAKVFRENAFLQEQIESFEFLEEIAAGAEEQDANVSEYIAMTEGGSEERTGELQTSVYAFGMHTNSGNSKLDAEVLTQLLSLEEESSGLLAEFAGRFPKAFLHVRRVASIGGAVAERLDSINTELVRCGGYYHEIGRLRGAKSLKNTLEVAMEEAFPTALQAVLREHTIDGDKPTSKEAALLMLTDNICEMCEYLKKTQNGKILIAKVIDRALNLRLTKGDLNLSGLTVSEFAVIRNTLTEVIKEEMF